MNSSGQDAEGMDSEVSFDTLIAADESLPRAKYRLLVGLSSHPGNGRPGGLQEFVESVFCPFIPWIVQEDSLKLLSGPR